MPDTCCAVGCTNRREKKDDDKENSGEPNAIIKQQEKIPFYRIPSKKKVEKRQKWLAAIKREDWDEEKIKNARLCGEHFITGNFFLRKLIELVYFLGYLLLFKKTKKFF